MDAYKSGKNIIIDDIYKIYHTERLKSTLYFDPIYTFALKHYLNFLLKRVNLTAVLENQISQKQQAKSIAA